MSSKFSDCVNVLHIKQERDSSSNGNGGSGSGSGNGNVGGEGKASCYSPTASSSTSVVALISGNGVNRSNSYSNGTTTSNSSNSSSVGSGSGSGRGGGGSSTALSKSSSGGNGCSGRDNKSPSSPSVSPDRQLCSSTTTTIASSDLASVGRNKEIVTSNSSSNNNGLLVVSASSDDSGSRGVGGGSGNGGVGGSIRDELRRLCLVCGDVASGFHYGVASCEACKAFFKRTIQGNIEYTCPANNECEINKRRRKACQACRFQKCLLMGMLKEGVRLDRVRGGRQKYRRNPVSNSYQTMQLLYQSGTTSLDDVKILDVLNSYEPDAYTVHQQSPSPSPSPTPSDVKMTTTTTTTTTISPTATTTTKSAANGRLQVKLEQETISPPATPTSTNIKLGYFPSSGGIISNNNNNDPQDILCILSDLYDKELVGVIGWAKQIPGFTELPLNDQMKLLQVSWAEILTLQLTFRSLPFNGKLCFANDLWMDELLAKECGYVEFYYHCVQVAQRLERLSPRREEYYLLKALLLSNCDILLDDQSSLRAFRDTILNSLNDVVYLLRHSSAVSHQQQLLLIMPSLRQADGILRRFWRRVYRDGGVTMNKLFVEMLEPVAR